MKKSIPHSQALRYRRIISEDQHLDTNLKLLKGKFISRQYPETLIDKQIDRVRMIDRRETLVYKSAEQRTNY